MENYKYKAINESGRPIRGVLPASGESDLYAQLQSAGMELVDCSPVGIGKGGGGFSLEKVTLRDLIQLFIHMEQMQSAGVPLLDSLSDIRDSAENNRLRDMMSEIHRDVSEGVALSEAMGKHPKVFHNLYLSLIKAGEDTGDLTTTYRQLIKYLTWVDAMQTKVRKATRYPMIVMVVVLATVIIMMGFVVPQIVGFIENLGQALPFYTIWLINTSEFFKSFWWLIVLVPLSFLVLLKFSRYISEDLAYRLDLLVLNAPVSGNIIRKISIARYAQTFGALFASGIDVVNALKAARLTVTNLALLDALEAVEKYVQSGTPLSEAFNASGEFPSMVVRMLKIGERSGNLTSVLDHIADFYTKDVDEAIDGLISMIEPALTGLLGGMILWIAVSVFGPIYSSFENIDF